MNREHIIDAVGNLPEDVIRSVDAVRTRKKPNSVWLKWGALAACLCVVLALTVPLLRLTAGNPDPSETPDTAVPTPDASTPDGCVPYALSVNGRTYQIASYDKSSETLPEGYSYGGDLEDGRTYYTNPDIPEWVYVYQQHRFPSKRDPETGKLVEDIRYVYFRWVDVRLHNKELLYYNGEYYISLKSAGVESDYEKYPDITREYYNTMVSTFGDERVVGEPKYGFELIGQTTYTGQDTIPENELESNVGVRNVGKTGVTGVLLVSNAWTEGKKVCRGYDVYVRYDCPFA